MNTVSSLSRHMESGDLIIDGGDEWFRNSTRRAEFLDTKGIKFIGMGMSGGEEGARNGPSLMLGGPLEAYNLVEPILTKCAAYVDPTGSCVGYMGPVEAGHYVKMVHNGIEYCEMQLIAEVYDILKNLLKLSSEEMADIFDDWQKGELSSYLLEITATILRKKDDTGAGGHVVDYIRDETGMKGTGMWSVQEAAEKGVAVPTLAAAVNVRLLSARKPEREAASGIYGEAPEQITIEDKQQVIDDLKASFYASKVCSYAQGLRLIKAASDEYDWNLNIAECARVWTGGCIIRSKLATEIHSALSEYDCNDIPTSVLLCTKFAQRLKERAASWRRLAGLVVSSGIGCPSLVGSLTYFDTYRRNKLPANLTQAQRDFFGGHSYQRTDKEGRFHTIWSDAHQDIGKADDRHYGVDTLERGNPDTEVPGGQLEQITGGRKCVMSVCNIFVEALLLLFYFLLIVNYTVTWTIIPYLLRLKHIQN